MKAEVGLSARTVVPDPAQRPVLGGPQATPLLLPLLVEPPEELVVDVVDPLVLPDDVPGAPASAGVVPELHPAVIPAETQIPAATTEIRPIVPVIREVNCRISQLRSIAVWIHARRKCLPAILK